MISFTENEKLLSLLSNSLSKYEEKINKDLDLLEDLKYTFYSLDMDSIYILTKLIY